MRASLRRLHSRAGYKIAELMVAVGIFVLGGGVAYPLLVGDLALSARNLSINKSNNSLLYSLERLKHDIDLSIEPPVLVNYTVSGNTGVLQPQPDTVKSANGILLWVNLGSAYEMEGSLGASATAFSTVPVTGTITLKRNTTPTNAPMPQVGDRLVILAPTPFSSGMPETVNMNGNTVQKPGRRIMSVNGATSNPVADTASPTLTVTLDLSNTALPANITGPQSVYVVREVVYAVSTLTDTANNPVESRLIRYASTANMTSGLTLIRDVDPAPPQIDANTGVAVQPFNYYGVPHGALSINLPVRAIDYANAITNRQSSASSEFNVSLLSSPQMANKVTSK